MWREGSSWSLMGGGGRYTARSWSSDERSCGWEEVRSSPVDAMGGCPAAFGASTWPPPHSAVQSGARRLVELF
jgi:hypothetical protein